MPLATITQLEPFNINSSATFSFASTSVAANVAAGNIKTDNLLYANGVAWTFGSSTYSNSNVEGYLPTYSGLVGGTLSTNAQPNITSVGTLSSLTVTGLVTATAGGVKVGNIQDASGTNTIQVSSGTTGIIGNLNVGTGGTGNVTATYFIGNGSQLTGLPASYSNANVAAYLPTYTGNFTAGNANISGTLTAGAFTTSGSSGNISGANYVVANFFSGDGSLLDNIVAGNIDGQVSNALVAGTVYTNAQPNITSVGTLSDLSVSGNATVTGNLTVGGNVNYINVDTLVIEDPIIEQGGGANGAPLTTNDGKDRGSLLHYYTTAPVDAFMGWDNSNGEFAFGSNVSVSSEVVTFNTLGNVRANTFIGSLSGAATTAATVTTNAQPNITSVGTLTSLSVTGNVTASYLIGNGSQLTGLPASYANANVATYLPTYTGNLSPSNLVVSTSANLGAVENITITGGTTGQILSTDGSGTLSWSTPSGGTTITVDTFTGNGVQVAFTLSSAPTDANYTVATVQGVVQPRSYYTVVGTTLTFSTAPPDTTVVEVTTFSSGSGGGGTSSAAAVGYSLIFGG